MELICLVVGMVIGAVLGWFARGPVPVVVAPRPEIQTPVAAAPPPPVAAPRPAKPTVCVRLMDANERRVIRTYTIDAAARRPTLTFPEGKYICARQNARGEWIYREVRH